MHLRQETITFETDSSAPTKLIDTLCFVEATPVEYDHIHQYNANNGVIWEEDIQSHKIRIGYVKGDQSMPVYIQLRWAKVNGHRVCFYDSCSNIVDWSMIENWICTMAPRIVDARNLKFDAMNFHLCLRAIENIEDKKIQYTSKQQ